MVLKKHAVVQDGEEEVSVQEAVVGIQVVAYCQRFPMSRAESSDIWGAACQGCLWAIHRAM